MSDRNETQIEGTVFDVQIKQTKGGKNYAEVVLNHATKDKDKNDVYKKVKITAWGSLAEVIVNFKNKPMLLICRVDGREYEGKLYFDLVAIKAYTSLLIPAPAAISPPPPESPNGDDEEIAF